MQEILTLATPMLPALQTFPMMGLLLKITVLLGLGWFVHLGLRAAHPRWRALLWRAVANGVIVVGVACLMPAGVEVKVIRPEPSNAEVPQERIVSDRAEASKAFALRETLQTVALQDESPAKSAESPLSLSSDRFPSNAPAAVAPAPVTAHRFTLPHFSLWQLLLAAWVAGFVFRALQLLVAHARLRRLIADSSACPLEMEMLAQEVAEALHYRTTVSVRVSDSIPTPMVSGLRRAVILMPRSISGTEQRLDWPAILAHETAHLVSRDLLWGFVLQWVRAALWFHPLAWGIGEAHLRACEEGSDATAASFVGDARLYSKILARLVVSLVPMPVESAAIPMARMSDVTRRITLLSRTLFASRLSRRRVLLFGLSSFLLAGGLGALRLAYAEAPQSVPVSPRDFAPSQPSANAIQTPIPLETRYEDLFTTVTINRNTENRHRRDQYPYQEQQWQGATNVLGTIHSDIVWTKDKSPYVMQEHVFVGKDGSLRIEPGVEVKAVRLTPSNTSLIDAYVGLHVNGSLHAEGTPQEMIRFGALSTTPDPYREWQGIVFGQSAKPSILKWAVVEDAIFGVDCYGSPLIAHCLFRKCHTGIYLESDFVGDVIHNISELNAYSGVRCKGTRSEATIRNNIFHENGDGIDAWADSSAYADYNLYWSGRGDKHYTGMQSGPHDVTANPRFRDPAQLDFTLLEGSPALAAGYEKADMGLDARNWSKENAKSENEQWLGNGARPLWYQGLKLDQRNPQEACSYYQEALDRKPDPELRDKIAISFAGALVRSGNAAEAKLRLQETLADSMHPHLRDLCRKTLAELLAREGDLPGALALLDKTEWAQSQIWLESVRAKCAAIGGKPAEALASVANLKNTNPDQYVQTLAQMVDAAIKAGDPDNALKLCAAFDQFPLSGEAALSRTNLAKFLTVKGRLDDAEQLLRKAVDQDPLGRYAPQILTNLADTIALHDPNSAKIAKIRQRLGRDYFPRIPEVRAARLNTTYEPLPPNRLILIESSMNESSVFDRGLHGSNNFGQYEVMAKLHDMGFTVHTNDNARPRGLAPEVIASYGLIIMNGRYGGTNNPPIPEQTINDLERYVEAGGSLLVIGNVGHLGDGKTGDFYNPLLKRFGLEFQADGALPWQANACAAADHPAMKGLTQFVAQGGALVKADEGEVLGTYQGNPVIVCAKFGKGRVVAAGLGSGLMGNTINEAIEKSGAAAQNKALLGNLATWLMSFASSEIPKTPMAESAPAFRSTSLPAGSAVSEITRPAASASGTIAIALEAYHVDHNRYPAHLYQLTTPIAYLSSIPSSISTEQFQALPKIMAETKAPARNVAAAIEAYHVDYNRYPAHLYQLTTPVAYLSSARGNLKNNSAAVRQQSIAMASIPGRPIPEDQAMAIVERLNKSVFNARDSIESLTCEFEPKFIDQTDLMRMSMGDEYELLAKGRKVGTFEGMDAMLFCLLDEGLSSARKAVFYFSKAKTNQQEGNWGTTVCLFDAQGQRINLHSNIEALMGFSMLQQNQMYSQTFLPRWLPASSKSIWEWRMDDSDPNRNVLRWIDKRNPNRPMITRITFAPDGPLQSVERFITLTPEGESESLGGNQIFSPLPESNLVGITSWGGGENLMTFEWTSVNGIPVVETVLATRPNPFSHKPYEINFTNIQVNTEIPDEVFTLSKEQAEARKPVKIDLATPEATINTVLQMIRRGQLTQMITYCAENIPASMPQRQFVMPTIEGYHFDTYEYLRENLKVTGTHQTAERWTYTIQIPSPARKMRAVEVKLKQVNGEWKVENYQELMGMFH